MELKELYNVLVNELGWNEKIASEYINWLETARKVLVR